MRIYNSISKQIGWQPRAIEVPCEAEARKIIAAAAGGNVNALKRLLEINRFALAAEKNIDVINLIHQSLNALKQKY